MKEHEDIVIKVLEAVIAERLRENTEKMERLKAENERLRAALASRGKERKE